MFSDQYFIKQYKTKKDLWKNTLQKGFIFYKPNFNQTYTNRKLVTDN